MRAQNSQGILPSLPELILFLIVQIPTLKHWAIFRRGRLTAACLIMLIRPFLSRVQAARKHVLLDLAIPLIAYKLLERESQAFRFLR